MAASSSAKACSLNVSSIPSACCAAEPKAVLVDERAFTPLFTSVLWL